MNSTLYDKDGSGRKTLTNCPQSATFPGARIHEASDQTVPYHSLILRKKQNSVRTSNCPLCLLFIPSTIESYSFSDVANIRRFAKAH